MPYFISREEELKTIENAEKYGVRIGWFLENYIYITIYKYMGNLIYIALKKDIHNKYIVKIT